MRPRRLRSPLGGGFGVPREEPCPEGSGAIALLRSLPPAGTWAFSRDAEHQAAEEARPDRSTGAAREPALPLDCEDALAAPAGGRRRRRRRSCGRGAQAAGLLARPGGRARRDPPEHGRPAQGAGRAPRVRLALLI